MSDPLRRTEQTWQDAESLVRQIDRLSHASIASDEFFQQLADATRQTAKSRSVLVWSIRHGERHVLARSGIDVHHDTPPHESVAIDHVEFAAASHWFDEAHTCITQARVTNDSVIGIELRWPDAVDATIQPPLSEMCKAVLESATLVFLRHQADTLQNDLSRRQRLDKLVTQLHRGVGIRDSFAHVGQAVAKYVGADRVSILYSRTSTPISDYRLVSCSTSVNVDRRSRLARLMQDLASQAARHDKPIEFVVGSGDTVPDPLRETLDAYLMESGSRAIAIEPLSLNINAESAVIVLEQFTVSSRHDGGSFADLRDVVGDALTQAMRRDAASLRSRLDRWFSLPTAKKATVIALVIATLTLLMTLVHVDFWIPAQGRVVASQRHSVYAPADGVVTKLPVDNGSTVAEGQTLVVIRSHDLDTKQRQIEGEIAALQTSLAAITAGRSSSPSEIRDQNRSTNEQVLKSKIEGLLLQLDLVTAQQQALVVRSPITGKVDHWNMRENLASRPITRGQFLAEVYSPGSGWELEIEVSDLDSGYLFLSEQDDRRRCRFSLRSSPQDVFEAELTQLDNVTQIDAQGDWVIKGVARPATANTAALDSLRTGATARVEIWTGRRPIGFVWFRGLIQWWRTTL
ncbi:alkaline proteinase secretion protein aprE [Rhodopirellula maiorica SM1]|uniref:Alkaline proteinase secretion protein aprE n=1 Tax=Rhodopirellula maiorica SM1 TaxID=1265738 RepID=M5RJM2_9BACT|nr:biotin/lipoyl-binding protein [Rhodopirellula maiorica]EMI19500.1 alkaline proteinase secretion protein aprE [Rhodopirellula maiorica SM1]